MYLAKSPYGEVSLLPPTGLSLSLSVTMLPVVRLSYLRQLGRQRRWLIILPAFL